MRPAASGRPAAAATHHRAQRRWAISPLNRPTTVVGARNGALPTSVLYAQGDMRANIMQAPKLTLFNGQTATLSVTDQQFFVTSVQVVSVNGQIVFIPQNQPLSGPDTNFNITIQAVVSADRRSWRPRATVSVGHRIVVTLGDKGKPPELVVFRIVNTGDRPIRVTQIGWRVGLWNRRYAIQMYQENQSSPLPIDLSHGQVGQWNVPLDAPLRVGEEPWLEYFAKGMLMPNWRVSCATLRAQFFTSVGEVFVIKPESTLLTKLRRICATSKRTSG